MIPNGLLTQIGMLIVSVAIIFTYIQPSFAEVEQTQNEIVTYQEERQKVVAVNSRLSSLVSQVDNVPNDDRRRLLAYMPDKVDKLNISRDLLLITQEAGVLYRNVGYEEAPKNATRQNTAAAADATQPIPHQFTLSVEGTYSQLKGLFALLEQNHYPLEVQEVSIQKIDGGFLSADITLTTYAFNFTSEAAN